MHIGSLQTCGVRLNVRGWRLKAGISAAVRRAGWEVQAACRRASVEKKLMKLFTAREAKRAVR